MAKKLIDNNQGDLFPEYKKVKVCLVRHAFYEKISGKLDKYAIPDVSGLAVKISNKIGENDNVLFACSTELRTKEMVDIFRETIISKYDTVIKQNFDPDYEPSLSRVFDLLDIWTSDIGCLILVSHAPTVKAISKTFKSGGVHLDFNGALVIECSLDTIQNEILFENFPAKYRLIE